MSRIHQGRHNNRIAEIFSKVHIFWEGHKILRNLPLTFDCMYWPSQNIWTFTICLYFNFNFKLIKATDKKQYVNLEIYYVLKVLLSIPLNKLPCCDRRFCDETSKDWWPLWGHVWSQQNSKRGLWFYQGQVWKICGCHTGHPKVIKCN